MQLICQVLQLTQPPPLIYFHLGIFTIHLDLFQLLVSQFRQTLTHLSFTVDFCETRWDMFDWLNGTLWETLFTHTLTKITQFHLLIRTPLPSNCEQYLETFRTSFWLNKKWFVDFSKQGKISQLNTRRFTHRRGQNQLDAWEYLQTLRSNEVTLEQVRFSGQIFKFFSIWF